MEELLIIVGNNQPALGNIASNTESLGLKAVIISNSLTGEAREVGEAFAEKVKNLTIVFSVFIFLNWLIGNWRCNHHMLSRPEPEENSYYWSWINWRLRSHTRGLGVGAAATIIFYQDQSLRRTHITGHWLIEGYAATQEGWGSEHSIKTRAWGELILLVID